MREQRAADAHVRCHCATEIAGQQDRAEDRGWRERIEQRADDGDDAETPRQRFAGALAHPVHRFRDNRPGHELDRAIEQQEDDDETAENAPRHKRALWGRLDL